MYFPPTKKEYVSVFMKRPPGKYIEMGEITVKNVSTIEMGKRYLKSKAAELGGDAVYIISIVPYNKESPYGLGYDYYSGNFGFGYNYRNIETRFNITGVVIKYSKN